MRRRRWANDNLRDGDGLIKYPHLIHFESHVFAGARAHQKYSHVSWNTTVTIYCSGSISFGHELFGLTELRGPVVVMEHHALKIVIHNQAIYIEKLLD